MTTEEEKKPQDEETQKQDTTQKPENNNQGAESNETERNSVELSKKRQRKELRKDTGGEAGEGGAKPGLGERIREDIRKDIETAKQEIAEAKAAFTPLRKRETAQQNAPVQGIQGEGFSTPEQAPAEDGIQPDEFAGPETEQPAEGQTAATPETVPAPAGQPEASTPLTQQVNRDFNAVAAGISPTNSANVEASQKNRQESSQTVEQENKTLAAPAQEMFDRLKADKEAAGQAYAAAQEKYSVPSAQDTAERKIAEAEAQKGSPLTAKERRRLKREAERETEASLDKIYRELDPNYKSGKDFRREQNIKTIIGAIGKLGTMAGQTVTAANSGILLPTKSFSDGIMEDVRISDKERKELLRAYDEIRQAKINEPLARLQAAEKAQLDLVKSGAAYQTGKVADTQKDFSETGEKVEKKKEKIDYKDWIESQGGAKSMFGKLKNGEYVIPDIYRNGMPTGAHKVTLDVFANATGNLFDVFKTLPGVKTNANGQVQDDNGNIWVDLHQLQEDIAGAEDAGSREKLQQRYVEYLDKMLKFMEKSEQKEAKDALRAYSNLLKGASLDYRAYGESAGEQSGTDDDTI